MVFHVPDGGYFRNASNTLSFYYYIYVSLSRYLRWSTISPWWYHQPSSHDQCFGTDMVYYIFLSKFKVPKSWNYYYKHDSGISVIGNLSWCWLSCLCPLVFLLTRTVNYLAFTYFGFERMYLMKVYSKRTLPTFNQRFYLEEINRK